MANAMKKTTVKTPVVNTEETEVAIEKEVKETPVVPKKEKKVFKDSDEIYCVSITPGELFVEGKRSKDLYSFADMDYGQHIRYDDLLYLVRSHHPSVFKPRFIIHDEDFLNNFPEIGEVYSQAYSSQDLLDILSLSPSKITTKLNTLPDGAKEAFLTLVAKEIDLGQFDSANRVKAIDDYFGTKLFLKLSN